MRNPYKDAQSEILEGTIEYFDWFRPDEHRLCSICGQYVHEDEMHSNGTGLAFCPRCAATHPMAIDTDGYEWSEYIPFELYLKGGDE